MLPLADALARTRLRPPRLRTALVERPALAARLDAALRGSRLVLLSAPAGYGKTALLTQALQRAALPACAWISLDEDDDLPRLLAALLAALDPLDLPWRVDPEALVQAAQRGQPQAALAALVNALDVAEVAHGLIVLDDVHRLADPAAAPWLAALVERLPAAWTLVLCGRQPPPLPLARWRAAGELAEFGPEALRFDEAEVQALCALLGVPPALAAPLQARTGGWPAGLRLGLMALQAGAAGPPAAWAAAPAAPALAGGDPAAALPAALEPALFGYLASEVLAQLPPALQVFLRRCAVLPQWSPRRCAAVSGDAEAARWLDELERRGLFVAQLHDEGHDERVLVLHDLLRDCLLHLLQRDEPEALPGLLQRAAAVEPEPLKRVALLQRAGAWEAAEAALCELGAETVGAAGTATLKRLLAAFPAAQRAGSARLQWLRGLTAWVEWHWSEMHAALGQTEALARAQGDTRLARRAMAHLALAANALELEAQTGPAVLRPLLADPDPETRLCALVAQAWWDYDHTDYAPIAGRFAALLELLQQHGGSPRLWYQSAPTPAFTAMPGMQPLLARWCALALQQAVDRGGPLRALAYTYRGFGALWAGRVSEARQALDEGEADCRWLGEPPTVLTPLRMARLLLAAWQGDQATLRDGVQALLPLVVDAAPDDRPGLWQLLFATFGLRLAAAADDAQLLAHCADLAEAAAVVSRRPLYRVHRGLVPAHRASAAQRWDDAVLRWRQALAQAPQIDLLGQAAEARLRLAHALLQAGGSRRGGPRLGGGTQAAPGAGADGGADTDADPRTEAADAVRAALAQAAAEGQPARLWMAGARVLQALAETDWSAHGNAAPPDAAALRAQLQAAWAGLRALRSGGPAAPLAQAAGDALTAPAPGPAAPAAQGEPGTTAPDAGGPAVGTLSQREQEVLERIAAGDSNKHIARAFDLSPHTVKRHVANILDKLGLASRGQAAAWWRTHAPRR